MNYYSIKKEKLSPKEVALHQQQSRKLLWEGFNFYHEKTDERDITKNLFRRNLSEETEIFIPHNAQTDVFSNDTGTHLIPDLLKNVLINIKTLTVVRPLTVEDIKKFVETSVNNKFSFTIRGTGTWPFGGCVPLNGDIILDLSQLRRMELNKKESLLYLEPGVTFAEARNYLRDEGFALIQEITNPYSGTVAGWISTGGQGLGSYKYGHVTESIAEIQIVTPSGDLKNIKKDDKDFSLYTGTEGQLGIIAGVTLKVQENRYITKPYAFTFQSCKESVEFIKKISDNDLSPTSVIYYDEPYIKLVCEIERENLVKLQHDCLERKDEKRLSEISSDLDELKLLKNSSHVIVMEFDTLPDYQKALRTGMFDSSRPVFKQLPVNLAHKLWNHRYAPVQIKQKGPSLIVSENIIPLAALEKYRDFCSRFVKKAMELDLMTEAHILKNNMVLVQSIVLADTAHLRHYTYLGLVPFFSQIAINMGGKIYGTGIWNTPFMKNNREENLKILRKAKDEADPAGYINRGKFLNYKGRNFIYKVFSNYTQKILAIASHVFEGGSGENISWLLGTVFPRVVPAGSRVKRDPVRDITCVCAECDSCERVCPTGDIFGSYGPATPIIRRRTANRLSQGKKITQEEALGFLVCTRCGNCNRVCPASVPLTDLYDLVEKDKEFNKILLLTEEEKEDFIGRAWQIMKESPLYGRHTQSVHKDEKSHLQHGINITYPRDFEYASLYIDRVTCIHCGMCSNENACTYGARTGVAREIPELSENKCALCNACVNYCPMNRTAQKERILLDRYIYNATDLAEKRYWIRQKERIHDTTIVKRSEILKEVADIYVTDDIVMEIDRESSTGKIPVSGMGQGDRHMGIGFDAERFSHFHIVGPAQNRLHEGDPDEELSVTLGKRDPFCVFDEKGHIINRKHPQLLTGTPVIYNVMPLESNGKVELALINVAEKQKSLVIMDFQTLLEHYPSFLKEGNYEKLPSVIVPRVNYDISQRLITGQTVGREFLQNLWTCPMFELPFHKGMAETLTYVKECAWQQGKNVPLISGYLPVSEYDIIGDETLVYDIEKKIDYLLELNVDVIHIEGLRNRDKYFVTSKAVKALHHYLLSTGKRFEVSIIASGGIRLASDTQKTIQRGADATAIDFAALLSLDPSAYQAIIQQKTSTEKLLGLETEWAVKRLQNQAESRKVQIIEVLGASGFKDIKKTVGEEGRLIDFNILEERIEKDIFEDPSIIDIYKKINEELINYENSLDINREHICYSELKKLIKPAALPHHFYCLGSDNQSLYSKDYVWPGKLIESMGRMASGDMSMINLKHVQATGNLGDGFDVMGLRYSRNPADLHDEELDMVRTGVYPGKNLNLKAPWMFGGKSVGSVGLDTWRAQVVAARTLGIQVDTGEGGYATSFFLNKKGEPLFFTEQEVQSIKGFFRDGTWYCIKDIRKILEENRVAEKHSHILTRIKNEPDLSPVLFKTIVDKEDEPYVSTELKTGLFGVTKETIKKARRVVIAYSQGAKMGIGGHILSQKVNRLVAYLRGIEGIQYIKEEEFDKLINMLHKFGNKEKHPLKEYAEKSFHELEKFRLAGEVTDELKESLLQLQNKAYKLHEDKLLDPLEFQQIIRLCTDSIDYSYTSIISPFPFHNCYSIEDVKAFIDIVRMINPDAVIAVKVSPSIDIEFIAAGLARIAKDNTVDIIAKKAMIEGTENLSEKSAEWAKKYGMNIEIWLDGPRGGTGASPNIIKGQMGMHIEYAIPLIHNRLVRDGLRNYIKFFVSGGIRTYEDVIKSVALGADGVIWGTGPMVAIGCDRNRNCHDGCSRGIATSNLIMQKLRDIEENTTQIINAFTMMQMQVIRSLASLGINDIRELRGRFDLIHWMGLKERVDHRIRLRREASLQLARQKVRDLPKPHFEQRRTGVSNCGVAAVHGTEPVPAEILHKTLQSMENRGMDGVGIAKSLCFPSNPDEYAFTVLVKDPLQIETESSFRDTGNGTLRKRAREETLRGRENLVNIIRKIFLEDVFELFPGSSGLIGERDSYRKNEAGEERDFRDFGSASTDPGDIYRFFVRVKKNALQYYIENNLFKEPQKSLWEILFPGINRENYRNNEKFLRKAEDSFVFNRSVLISSMLYAYEIKEEYRESFIERELRDENFWREKYDIQEITPEIIENNPAVRWTAEKGFFEKYPYPWHKYRYKERTKKIATVLSCGKNFACWKTAGREIPWETPPAPNNIIHVRLATGSVVEQMNAHPFSKLNTALTHNGETTNYEALKQRVEQFGHTPLAGTDTDVAALKFHLLSDEWSYPDWALFESFSPTTGDDLLLVEEHERESLERVQRVEFASSPDGPYQYLCLRHDPHRHITERVDLKDPADLRPNVSMIWHERKGDKLRAFSIIASEEQAGHVMLDLMDRTGIIDGAEADETFVSPGMISRATFDEKSEITGMEFIDRYGKTLNLTDPGTHYSYRRSYKGEEKFPAIEETVKHNFHQMKDKILENIASWTFEEYAFTLNYMVEHSKDNEKSAIKTFTWLIDYLRTINTGDKARGSLRDITVNILYKLFDNISAEGYRKTDIKSVSAMTEPKSEDDILIVDGTGFLPEGIDRDTVLAPFLSRAYDLGWKNFILYRVSGQRCISTAPFGTGDTDDVSIDIYGKPGEYAGAFMQGGTIRVHGNAQNFTAMVMHHGNIYIYGNAGKVCGYASKGGHVFIMGNIVDRAWTNSVNDPRCQNLDVRILGYATKYAGESLMGGDFFFGGLTFDVAGNVITTPRPYEGTKLLGGASKGSFLFFDPWKKLEAFQYRHGIKSEITESLWNKYKPRVLETFKEANISIINKNGGTYITVDNKEIPVIPEKFTLILPRGGLKGYESH